MTRPRLEPGDEHLLRTLAPGVLAAVLRRYRDFPAAEDAVQEALLAAAQQWPRYGRPDDPRAWLIRVASRRWADEQRAAIARRRREEALADAEDELAAAGDDRARRNADAAVHVLPSGALAVVAGGADVAGRGWSDDGRDREGVPGPRGHHGAENQPRQGDGQSLRRGVRATGAHRDAGAPGGGAARHLPGVQRRVHGERRCRAATARPGRGSVAARPPAPSAAA